MHPWAQAAIEGTLVAHQPHPASERLSKMSASPRPAPWASLLPPTNAVRSRSSMLETRCRVMFNSAFLGVESTLGCACTAGVCPGDGVMPAPPLGLHPCSIRHLSGSRDGAGWPCHARRTKPEGLYTTSVSRPHLAFLGPRLAASEREGELWCHHGRGRPLACFLPCWRPCSCHLALSADAIWSQSS